MGNSLRLKKNDRKIKILENRANNLSWSWENTDWSHNMLTERGDSEILTDSTMEFRIIENIEITKNLSFFGSNQVVTFEWLQIKLRSIKPWIDPRYSILTFYNHTDTLLVSDSISKKDELDEGALKIEYICFEDDLEQEINKLQRILQYNTNFNDVEHKAYILDIRLLILAGMSMPSSSESSTPLCRIKTVGRYAVLFDYFIL